MEGGRSGRWGDAPKGCSKAQGIDRAAECTTNCGATSIVRAAAPPMFSSSTLGDRDGEDCNDSSCYKPCSVRQQYPKVT